MTDKDDSALRYIVRTALLIIFCLALLFIAAGRTDWVNGWVFAILTVSYFVLNSVVPAWPLGQ